MLLVNSSKIEEKFEPILEINKYVDNFFLFFFYRY